VRADLRLTQCFSALRRGGDCASCLAVLLLLAAWAAHAQSAGEFFNGGAQLYISNNIPAALGKVEDGRKLYPDDVKLKKLEELLKQQSQQQQSQQNQQQQNQQNQQQKQDSQKSQQDQQAQNQPGKPADQQPSPKEQQKEKSEAQKEQKQAAGQEMSPEEAKRLLDAQKGGEQFLQFQPKNPPESQNKPIKDW
jgi:Ca-activated chloride channel family protein